MQTPAALLAFPVETTTLAASRSSRSREGRPALTGAPGALILALLLVSLSATPGVAWVWTYSGNLQSSYFVNYAPQDFVADVAAFPDGSIAVVGAAEDFWGPTFMSYELDWVIARIGRHGDTQWVFQLGSGLESTYDFPELVAIDPEGNLFVGGVMRDTTLGASRPFIVKVDGTTGDLIWSVFLSLPSSFFPGSVRSFAIDPAGNVAVAFASTSGLFRVVKIDGDDPSVTLWSYTESTSTSGQSTDVVLDSAGDALVAGALNTDAGPTQAFVAKLDGDTGVELWRNDTLAASVLGYGVTAAPWLLALTDGDAVVLAKNPGPTGGDSLVARLDASDGSVVWQRPLPFPVESITSDYSSRVYAAGANTPGVLFGMAAIDLLTEDLVWTEAYGNGTAFDIAITGDGKPVVTGRLQEADSQFRFNVIAADPVDGTQLWRTTIPSGEAGEGYRIRQTPEGDLVTGGRIVEFVDALGQTWYDGIGITARLLASDGRLTECGNLIVEDGESCEDGNVADGDCCSSLCQYDAVGTSCDDDGLACSTAAQCNGSGTCLPSAGDCCGDSTVQPTLGEQCDDANASEDDCCLSSCQGTYDTPCDHPDSQACNPTGKCGHFVASCYIGPSICDCCSTHTGPGCNQPSCTQCVANQDYTCNYTPSHLYDWHAGCVNIAKTTCASSCNCPTTPTTTTTTTTLPALQCPSAPQAGCMVGGGASLQVVDNGDDAKDRIQWKWKKGPAVTPLDLGHPGVSATYGLCVYDSTAGADSLAAMLKILPTAFWDARFPGGWDYKDSTGSQDGVQKIQLRVGVAGKSSAQLKAKGAAIPMPSPISGIEFFDQDTRVTVQLRNNQTSTCWTSEFTSAKRNSSAQYKAKF